MQELVNIHAERAKIKMSRENLATYLGVTSKTLRSWVDGTVPLPTDKLLMMTKLFGCSADYLLGISTQRNIKEVN